MDYRRSLEYLYGLQQFGIKLGLENVRELLTRLGNPQHALKIVHLAGTNGKGSTAAALTALLGSGGLRVGLYTSPHLHSFTERIQVSGDPIRELDVAELTVEIRSLASGIPVTFFEFTTVLALLYFQRQQVDWVVLETGLGGRLDATNAVRPHLCVLTPVAADHQAYLGEGLDLIGAEKAGIMKSGVPTVSAVQPPEVMKVIRSRGEQLQAPLSCAGTDWQVETTGSGFISYHGRRWHLQGLPQSLPGVHQGENLGLALAAAEILVENGCPLDPEKFSATLQHLHWPGRLEWWPGTVPVLLDGAHNPAGAQSLAEYLRGSDLKGLLLVTAFKADKAWSEVLEQLRPFCSGCHVAPLADQPSIAPERVLQHASVLGLDGAAYGDVAAALEGALTLAQKGQTVLVAGSLFLVAEARAELVLRSGSRPADCGDGCLS